jgi:hypothetical protein
MSFADDDRIDWDEFVSKLSTSCYLCGRFAQLCVSILYLALCNVLSPSSYVYLVEGFHKEFPRLFQPAFTLHLNMTRWVMGERFWNRKKEEIRKIKQAEFKRVSNSNIGQAAAVSTFCMMCQGG